MNATTEMNNANKWRLVGKGSNADKTALYFGFPDHATNAEINAKLEKMFFKTPYMDWFIIREDCKVAVYINAERYVEWKREQDSDSDSDDE